MHQGVTMSQNTTFEERAAEAGIRRSRRTRKLTRQKLEQVVLPGFLLHEAAQEPKTSKMFSFTRFLVHTA